MMHKTPLLVFTDLDGTLLSHENYDWQPASEAIDRLKRISAGVVLASSKTAVEIDVIRSEIGLNNWPAIVENGAGLHEANAHSAPEPSTYLKLRATLDKLPKDMRVKFTGFGDMDVNQVCQSTGLSQTAAQRAKQRAFSEPGIFSGTNAELEQFQSILATQGISARAGGRFLTLTFGATKGDQMKQIIAHYTPRYTVALGDAPNDIEMLQEADFGIIVANQHRDPLPRLLGEDTGAIIRTEQQGPQGWNDAMLTLLDTLEL